MMAVCVLALSQIIVTEMLLGVVFENLYAGPLFILNLTVSAGLLSFSIILSGKPGFTAVIRLLEGVLNEIKDGVTSFIRLIIGNRMLLSVFLFFIASICSIVFSGYLFPSYTWDALWYHLPIVGNIMQSGAIQEVAVNSFIDQFINIFPKNIELFFLWNIIFLQDSVITDLSQLPFAMAGVVAIYSIAVKMNIGKKNAAYSSLLFFFTPVIILQSATNYVDVAITGLFLTALNFLLDSEESQHAGNKTGEGESRQKNLPLIIAGLTAGILLGSKGSGPLFIITLSLFFVIKELRRHCMRQGYLFSEIPSLLKRTSKLYLLYFLIPVFLLGGYWYIKNWVIYGNPVYPMEISIFNMTIFKGLFKGLIEPPPEIIKSLSWFTRPLYVWSENISHYLYDSRLGGLGPIWFILFLPSIVFSVVYAIIRKRFSLLGVSMIIIITFLLYPRNWTPRYVIFVTGLGAISFGVALEYFGRRAYVLKITALFLAGYTLVTANSPIVNAEQIKKFIHLPAKERTIGWHAPFNIDIHARQEYGYWIWISRNISGNDNLAYTFEPLFHAPLWNNGFSNRISFIKSDTYKEWLKELKKSNVTHILVRQNSMEDKWIEKERKVFSAIGWLGGLEEKYRVVYSDENYKIVKFNET